MNVNIKMKALYLTGTLHQPAAGGREQLHSACASSLLGPSHGGPLPGSEPIKCQPESQPQSSTLTSTVDKSGEVLLILKLKASKMRLLPSILLKHCVVIIHGCI